MYKILDIKEFDRITQFRLLNLFLVSISIALLSPVIIHLKGVYMFTYVIGLFSISYTLALKTNKYMVPFGNSKLFKMGNIVHLFFTFSTILYFYNPLIMIYLDSFSMLLQVIVFSAYTITLQNYITKEYPESVPEFQIKRNNIGANGTLIGLGIGSLLLMHSIEITIIFFLVFNILFSIFLFWNWNFFENIERGIK